MVNYGDLCLLNNVFPVFHISGFVLISLTEFCTEFECFSQDLTEMLLILLSSPSPSAVCNGRVIESSPLLRSEQINGL